jgi:hypothetical protein
VRRLGSTDIRLADGAVIHAAEAMVLLRDPRDGRLIVHVGDTGYKSLDGAAGVRAAVNAAVGELTHLLNTGEHKRSVDAQPSRPAPLPPPTGTNAMPGDLPRYTELKDEKVSRGAFRPHKTEMPVIPELNIPAAIEAYLQYKKGFTDEYAHRSIHVLPAIGGGVRIEVDGTYYDSVGDVADSEVRAFLQATIQEWQKRQ